MTSEQPTVTELLVALADPASADREVGWAAAMARTLRVPVHLIHVLDPARGRDPVERAIAMADDLLAIAAIAELLLLPQALNRRREELMDLDPVERPPCESATSSSSVVVSVRVT